MKSIVTLLAEFVSKNFPTVIVFFAGVFLTWYFMKGKVEVNTQKYEANIEVLKQQNRVALDSIIALDSKNKILQKDIINIQREVKALNTKVINIRRYYNEKIKSIDALSNDELIKFLTDRYDNQDN